MVGVKKKIRLFLVYVITKKQLEFLCNILKINSWDKKRVLGFIEKSNF
jgi:hypothetical protein